MSGIIFYTLCIVWMIISFFIAFIIMKPIMDRVNPYGIFELLGIFSILAIAIGIGMSGVLFLKYLFDLI